MTDQQPVTCVGAYGNDLIKTPNLDLLAAAGHLMSNFYIATFPCSPSRASILTGRNLHHHNVFTNNVMLDPSIPTLGRILSDAGYATGYFGKAHLGGSMYVGRGGTDGIDYMHEPSSQKDPLGDAIQPYWHHERIETDSGWMTNRQEGGPGEDEPQLGFKVWKGGWKQYKNWLLSHGQDTFAYWAGNHDDLQTAPEGEHMYSRLGEKYHMAQFFTDGTEEFIQENQDRDKPWAAVLSYFGPHLPVAPPQPWDTLFDLSEITLPANFSDDLANKPIRQGEISGSYFRAPWTQNQYKDYIRRYWGYCGYIDQQIGRIFSLLKESGQWENTVVIFTSDHGDMLTGHGMIFKLGANAYEELFRVPAIMKIPGITGGKKYPALTSSIDLLPTILEATNIAAPSGIDGKSLLPLLRDENLVLRDYLFSEVHSTGRDSKTIMCRHKQFKYVYHWLSTDVDELYDLTQDPGELHNLIDSPAYQSVKKDMQKAIIKWVQETHHHYAELIAIKANAGSH
jgi:arylsulfatase A-like enzyme